MEEIGTTENERETQYISDEEVEAFDYKHGEDIKIDLSENIFDVKKATNNQK